MVFRRKCAPPVESQRQVRPSHLDCGPTAGQPSQGDPKRINHAHNPPGQWTTSAKVRVGDSRLWLADSKTAITVVNAIVPPAADPVSNRLTTPQASGQRRLRSVSGIHDCGSRTARQRSRWSRCRPAIWSARGGAEPSGAPGAAGTEHVRRHRRCAYQLGGPAAATGPADAARPFGPHVEAPNPPVPPAPPGPNTCAGTADAGRGGLPVRRRRGRRGWWERKQRGDRGARRKRRCRRPPPG